ncbi:hypothetical protein [Nioella nitratireducens]|uniref:hypothetical protein n=1 Tax=Nioella nitratireducens TaxID=1287720 RepID=UPI0008FD67A2|nr:hypothetical protein [Nioella nitratireducens]
MNQMQTPEADGRPSKSDWLDRMGQIGDMHGFFDPLGADHYALYVQEGDTLLVCFDEMTRILKRGREALPVGFDAVQKREWSMLSLIAKGPTWFRDPALYTFFDRLIDEDFFDSFDQVIFLGAGPMCGYAAAAFSVAAPGAKVIALSPAATLDRSAAPYELRFRRAWRKTFTDRFGFAPDMLDAASEAWIAYDPLDLLDAAHAAQFRGRKVNRLRFRGAGPDLLRLLDPQSNLDRILKATGNGRMSAGRFAQIVRRLRRENPDYLRRLMARVEERGGDRFTRIVADHALAVTGDAHYARRMMTLQATATEPA